jgi:hypothetical protein
MPANPVRHLQLSVNIMLAAQTELILLLTGLVTDAYIAGVHVVYLI